MYRFYSCYYWIRPLLSDYHLSMNGLSCQESVGKWREGYLERWSAVCLGKVPSDVTGHSVSNCNVVDHLNSEDKSPGCLCSCVSIKSVFEDHHDNSKVIWLSMWVFVPIACVCMCVWSSVRKACGQIKSSLNFFMEAERLASAQDDIQ